MTGFLMWTIIGATILAAGVVLGRTVYTDIAWAIVIAGLVVLALTVIIGGIRWVTLSNETKACEAFDEMGREVKLVDTGPIAWTCFVKVDGEWFAKENVWSDRP